jgi:WhiB family redox-sensing transcriptional regulator
VCGLPQPVEPSGAGDATVRVLHAEAGSACAEQADGRSANPGEDPAGAGPVQGVRGAEPDVARGEADLVLRGRAPPGGPSGEAVGEERGGDGGTAWAGGVVSRLPIDLGHQMDPRLSVQAACRGADPELFFAERGTNSTRAARELCRSCPICAECAEFAIVNNERFGVWGDTSVKDRRRIRRERALEAPPRTHCKRDHLLGDRDRAVGRCLRCRDASNAAARVRRADALPGSAPTLRLVAEVSS